MEFSPRPLLVHCSSLHLIHSGGVVRSIDDYVPSSDPVRLESITQVLGPAVSHRSEPVHYTALQASQAPKLQKLDSLPTLILTAVGPMFCAQRMTGINPSHSPTDTRPQHTAHAIALEIQSNPTHNSPTLRSWEINQINLQCFYYRPSSSPTMPSSPSTAITASAANCPTP